MEQFIWNLVSILVGGLITWVVAWLYYHKASRELIDETRKLRRLVNNIGRALDEAGLIEVNYDASGEVSGIVVHASAVLQGTATLSGALSSRVIPGSPPAEGAGEEKPSESGRQPASQ